MKNCLTWQNAEYIEYPNKNDIIIKLKRIKTDMAKKTQFRRRCIFCNGFKLSHEHIWSDWLTNRNVINDAASHSQSILRVSIDHSSDAVYLLSEVPQIKQGTLIQRKIRRVCNNCNNSWMSNIVDAAKPIAETIIREERYLLSADDQTRLSAWLMIACIMAEFTDELTMAIPECDRHFIRDNRVPPSDWQIFIGRYSGAEWAPTRYRHYGADVQVVRNRHNGRSITELHRFQVSTYTLGPLAVHAFSATFAPLADDFCKRFAPDGMWRIWPPGEDLAWPPRRVLNDVELMLISDTFVNNKFYGPQAN